MAVHGNLIDGEWVDGRERQSRTSTRPTSSDVVGEYARADTAAGAGGHRRRPRGLPGLVARRTGRSAPTCSTASATRSSPRRGARDAPLARGGQDPARGHRRGARARATSSSSSPARCVRLTRRALPLRPPRRRRSRSPASRSASSGIITPWNFPIAIPAWKIAPALAYGNCVVFKPADLVPGCAWALADILQRAGMPARGVQPRDGPRLGGRARRSSPRPTSTA